MSAFHSDLQILRLCAQNNAGAWVEFMKRFTPVIRSAVHATLRRSAFPQHTDPEDVVASVMMQFVIDDFRRLKAFEGKAAPASWVRAIAVNSCIDMLRREKLHHRYVADVLNNPLPGRAMNPESILARKQFLARIEAFSRGLSEADAQFCELYFRQGWNFSEISALTGASSEALYSRKNRLRKLLAAAAHDFAVVTDGLRVDDLAGAG